MALTPYYDREGITLYLGDCREILPQIEVPIDLVLTDPPYGIGEAAGKNKSRMQMAQPKDYGDSEWDDEPIDQLVMNQVVGKGKNAVVFGGNYYSFPPSSCWLVWDKDNSGDFADCELAWTNLKKAVRKFTWRWNGMLQEDMKHKEFRYHPTQKPVALMAWCLSLVPDAQMILDPFLGSGTTAVAAKKLGRKCIGIEREECYLKVAIERLRQGVLI